MSRYTLVTSIGRNIKNEPLTETAWDDFKFAHYSIFADGISQILSVSNGTGIWENTSEETQVIMSEVEKADFPRFQATLKYLGEKYGQEAIGFVSAPAFASVVLCDV